MKEYTLVLDSSNIDLLVGFLKDKVILDVVSYPAWQRQSENMIPEIKNLMEKNHILKEDIKSLAVTIGPGSYTGIRIALTIAKTIALALGCDVYPISSLYAMADFSKPSIVLLNARSSRSYIGVFNKNETILEDQIMSNEDVINYIKDHPTYKVIGDTEYLEINGEKPNIIKQISLVLPNLRKADNPLFIKPIYLKENYDTKIN